MSLLRFIKQRLRIVVDACVVWVRLQNHGGCCEDIVCWLTVQLRLTVVCPVLVLPIVQDSLEPLNQIRVASNDQNGQTQENKKDDQ